MSYNNSFSFIKFLLLSFFIILSIFLIIEQRLESKNIDDRINYVKNMIEKCKEEQNNLIVLIEKEKKRLYTNDIETLDSLPSINIYDIKSIDITQENLETNINKEEKTENQNHIDRFIFEVFSRFTNLNLF